MAEIMPFRALRYNPRFVPDLKQVVAPPYDVISPEAQERYHARHPYNVVRLILAKDEAADTPGDNRYTHAAATFAAWRRERILRRDPEPALYLYEQEFSIGDAHRLRRRGLLALVRLHEYSEKVIFPHERTFARYKDDRLRLMRACPANLEAILGFYPGPAPAMAAIFDRRMETDAAVRLVDEDGVGHRLWLVQDAAEVDALQAALRDRPVIIADGHHRYETALNFRNERRGRDAFPREAACDRLDGFVLMHLVQADDPGLVILPTHRVIRRRPACAGEALMTALARHFRIQSFPLDAANPLRTLRTALADLAHRRDGGIACALYAGGAEVLLLKLTDPTVPQALLAEGHAQAFAGLDVAVLHRLLIEGILGVPSTSQADDSIRYTREESQALAEVSAGEAALAIFLNAPRVEQVQAVAIAGERMPQKSTFFFPKVLSGLVMNPLDAEEEPPPR
jgi:uncharacterized protein (DUF1015 family)